MKKSTVALYLTVIALVVLVVYQGGINDSIDQYTYDNDKPMVISESIFPQMPIAEINKIHLSNQFGQLTLIKKDKKWLLKDRENYPANTARINEVLVTLAELKATQEIVASEQHWAAMSLLDPELTPKHSAELDTQASHQASLLGNKITLASANYSASIITGYFDKSNSEASIVFGDDFDGRQIVRLLPSNRVVLSDGSLRFVNTLVSNWIDVNWVGSYHNLHVEYFEEDTLQWRASRTTTEQPFELISAAEDNQQLLGLSQQLDYALSSVVIRDVAVAPTVDQQAAIGGIDDGHYLLVRSEKNELFKIVLGKNATQPEQAKAIMAQANGIMRNTMAPSWRYIRLEWPEGKDPSRQTPQEGRTYMIEAALLDNFLVDKRALLTYERLSAAQNSRG